MPEKLRFAPPGYALHITQRGNYGAQVFFDDADYQAFLRLLSLHADAREIRVHGYALMPNHFHLVATGQSEGGVSRFLQKVTGQYAARAHARLERRGRFWQSRFFACTMDEVHLFNTLAYVDLNPVRAALVADPMLYPWSSAAAHAGVWPAQDWLDLSLVRSRYTAPGWLERLAVEVQEEDLLAIRQATRLEKVLGEQGFVEALAEMRSRRQNGALAVGAAGGG